MIGKHTFGADFIVIGAEYHAKQRVFVVFFRGLMLVISKVSHECIITIRQLMQECV